MLAIRTEQIAALQREREHEFQRRLARHLRAIYPNEVGDDAELKAFIRRGVERSVSYGIVIEADVSRFVEYTIYFNDDFDRDPDLPWIREVLTNDDLDGTEKMDLIDARVEAQGLRSIYW
jgi:hypothetical protein